jgi:hypothetical protein
VDGEIRISERNFQGIDSEAEAEVEEVPSVKSKQKNVIDGQAE